MSIEEQAQFTKVSISEALARMLNYGFDNCARSEFPLTDEQKIEMTATSLRAYHTMASEVEEIMDNAALRNEIKERGERYMDSASILRSFIEQDNEGIS